MLFFLSRTKAFSIKLVSCLEYFHLLLGVQARYSCGKKGLDETPQGEARGGSLAARGKRVSARKAITVAGPYIQLMNNLKYTRMVSHIPFAGADYHYRLQRLSLPRINSINALT